MRTTDEDGGGHQRAARSPAGDEAAIAAARSALTGALAKGSLVICPVVYAELAASFPDTDTLDRFLGDL